MKDRSTLYLACAALGTFALAAAPAPQAHDNDARAQAPTTQQQLNSQRNRNDLVKIVKQVTDKYHSVAMAENDDYQLLFGCVSDEDSGAMGLHFVKLSLYLKDPQNGIFDDQIDPYQPEIILYEPTPWGPKLTGADYMVDAADLEQNAFAGARAGWPDLPLLRRTEPLRAAGRSTRCTSGRGRTARRGTFVNWNKDVRCDAHNGPNK